MQFSYDIHSDYIDLVIEGKNKRIFKTKDSGMLITLDEDSLHFFEFTHNGIVIGVDDKGMKWVVHNHWTPMKAEVTTLKNFTHDYEYKWIYLNKKCANNQAERLRIGLQQVKIGKPYHPIYNNCQHIATIACDNEKSSTELKKWVAVTLLFVFFLVAFRI